MEITRFVRASIFLFAGSLTMISGRGGVAQASQTADLPAGSTPQVCASESPHMPGRVYLTDDYLRERMAAMLRESPTFRAQCRRIAEAPLLRISVRRSAGLIQRYVRARSHIKRSQSGVMLALVELTPFGGIEEWIAHEFEHILEQLDGVRLQEMVNSHGPAWRSSADMFETERAIRAGRLVADEMRRARERTDKLVE